jgi:hypothetical protein
LVVEVEVVVDHSQPSTEAVVEVVPVDYTLQTQQFQNQPELRL